MQRIFFACLVLASFLSLLGCGSSTAVKLAPVSGKVTIQDMPLPYGRILLKPDAAQGNTSTSEPSGEIKSDGTFSLETDGKPGAPLGAYRVTIFSIKPSTPEDGNKPPVWAASQDYSNPEKSGLTLKVVENPAADAYHFALDKK